MQAGLRPAPIRAQGRGRTLAAAGPSAADRGTVRGGVARAHRASSLWASIWRCSVIAASRCARVSAPAAPEVRSRGAGRFQKEFGERVAAAVPAAAQGKPVEIWFQDEARVGQQGTLTRVWAKRGSRPRAPRDTRYEWTYLFGAVCPGRGTAAGLVLPVVNTAAMNAHLAEIACTVEPGAHAILVLDGAGWHNSKTLDVPDNISLLPLPPYSPEPCVAKNSPLDCFLNAPHRSRTPDRVRGKLWQFLRANWLAISVFDTCPAIVDACCLAWNRFADDPKTVTSITDRQWAQVNL